MDVDHRHAGLASCLGKPLDVLHDVLALGMRRGAGLGERTALDDHVVLKILDYQRGSLGIQAQGLLTHRFSSLARA